jgi:integrase
MPKPKKKTRADGRMEKKVNLGLGEDGKYIRVSAYGYSQQELDEEIRRIKNEHDRGVDVTAEKPTVKKWADKWLEIYKPNIGRTQRVVYNSAIDKWLKPLHQIRIDKVKPSDLQEILLSASKELAQSSVDKIYNCVRGIFGSARKNGFTSYDLSEPLEKPTKGRKSKRESLTEEEKKTLIRACEKEPLGALPMIMMYAGLRIGEALALAVSIVAALA